MMSEPLAVILESGDLGRLYTGLSLLVSAAADDRPAFGLVSFGALGPLLDDRLLARALHADRTMNLTPAGRETFARSLAELRETAAALPGCRLYACAAAVETSGTTPDEIEQRLDGVMSTPRFLRETAGAQLVVV